MNYGHWLVLLPFGVACSSATPLESEDKTKNDALGSNGSSLFSGAGTSGAGEALGAEIPPSTAHDCVPVGIGNAVPGAGPAEMTCFFDSEDTDSLSATIERRLEIVNDERWIHLRLTFNPGFVDNSYGETAIGWDKGEDEAAAEPAAEPPAAPGADPEKMPKPKPPKGKGGHTFKDLVGSDHAEFQLFDTSGELTMQFKLDYISESSEQASGYACGGVTEGEGKMIVGDADWVLGATTSLDRNLNGCGLSQYLTDSPATDEFYTPNADAPEWDFRVVYEVWVAEAPFGEGGFGDAQIEFVHASPSKLDGDTQIVVPGPCEPNVPPPTTTTPPETTTPPATTEPDVPTTSTPDGGVDEVPPRPITR
jgi:hypothetical protein